MLDQLFFRYGGGLFERLQFFGLDFSDSSHGESRSGKGLAFGHFWWDPQVSGHLPNLWFIKGGEGLNDPEAVALDGADPYLGKDVVLSFYTSSGFNDV